MTAESQIVSRANKTLLVLETGVSKEAPGTLPSNVGSGWAHQAASVTYPDVESQAGE